MGHSSGDTQLVMNLVLVLLGSGLFLGGLGSRKWVKDRGNSTIHYGLWEKCVEDDACFAIYPGSSAAYFETTRTIMCIALVAYALTLCTCFLADDRDPSESWGICVHRYIHTVAAFTAAGLTFLAIVVFAACYKDDDWFVEPSLGYSYWLTLAGCLVMFAGGGMRVVFITWPDRPALPIVKESKMVPHAPGKRRARIRTDDQLGADPLPVPLRPGDELKKKRPSRFKRFLGFFHRAKPTSSVADISTVCDAIQEKHLRENGIRQGEASNQGTTNGVYLPSALRKPSFDRQVDGEEDTSNKERIYRRHRKGVRLSANRSQTKKRVQIVEPFIGYNIPSTPGPDPPPLEDTSSSSDNEWGEGKEKVHQKREIKRYQKVVGEEDLRARVVSTPPSVVYPPSQGRDEMKHYITVMTMVEKHRAGSISSSNV